MPAAPCGSTGAVSALPTSATLTPGFQHGIIIGGEGTRDGVAGRRKPRQRRRGGVELALRDRFERFRRDGDLPPDADPDALARYVQTVFMGLYVQAAAGAPGHELRAVAERALAGWPA